MVATKAKAAESKTKVAAPKTKVAEPKAKIMEKVKTKIMEKVKTNNEEHDKNKKRAVMTKDTIVEFGNEVIDDMKSFQELMKDSIDSGSTTIEKVHQHLAKLPLKYLKKLKKIKSVSNDVMEIQQEAIGHTYWLIRAVNEKFADISGSVLTKTAGYIK